MGRVMQSERKSDFLSPAASFGVNRKCSQSERERDTEHVKGKFRGDEKLSQWCQANLLNV